MRYCLLTRGDKGVRGEAVDAQVLMTLREEEQRCAAAVLGVKHVQFLDYADGYLTADLDVRRAVVRVIRQEKPDIVVGCDPTNIFPNENYINHPDHRAAGQVVLDAVFPAAGNLMYFPELVVEGLLPCAVREVWLSIPAQANLALDVTAFWEQRLLALHEHRSQIGDDAAAFDARVRSRHTAESTDEIPVYIHSFRRIVFL